ncbi:hypothetical protein ACQKKK_15500 [Peribacillus sp. NPDC006672]|uniref:hypothetical protein n=1 Tax=Peribacillus sp. NPDC006672 TaxID=3390606 RepID=UPI003D02AD10
MKLLDTIKFYGFDILQEEAAFEKGEIIYTPMYEDGTTLDVKLMVTTDINGNITTVDSESSLMTMDILKKRSQKIQKPKKCCTI